MSPNDLLPGDRYRGPLDEFEAFDGLPCAVRRVLNAALFQWSAADLSSTLSIRKLCLRSELSIGMLSLAPRRLWPGTIRRVNDSRGLAHVGGQGKADRLEYTADISGHRRAHDEVFAVLLHLNVLKPIEIHQ